MTGDRDQAAQSYFDNLLFDDEVIVWRGRPSMSRCARREFPRLVYSIIFLVAVHFAARDGNLYWVFIVITALMSCGALVAPVRSIAMATRTYYAITTKRIIILRIGDNPHVVLVSARDIDSYEFTDHRNGTGSITLRRSVFVDNEGVERRRAVYTDGFWGVTDAKAAAEAIGALREA